MNPPEKVYSPFWALLLFFTVVLIFDLGQTVKLHREKLTVMQQYAEAVQLQPQAAAQLKWMNDIQTDLLRLAPGHPEASRIVAEFHLHADIPAH